MNIEDIDKFEKVNAQLESLHLEIAILSKKSSNDALNKFKLRLVNKSLYEANKILGEKYMPYNDFDQFLGDDLPTNSDVTIIIGQYLNCLEKLRADNIRKDVGQWYWVSENKITGMQTSPPRKIFNR